MKIEDRILSLFKPDVSLTSSQIRNLIELQTGQVANPSTVSVNLTRLVGTRCLARLGKGIYVLPESYNRIRPHTAYDFVVRNLRQRPDAWFKIKHLVENCRKDYGGDVFTEEQIRDAVARLYKQGRLNGDLAEYFQYRGESSTPEVSVDELLS